MPPQGDGGDDNLDLVAHRTENNVVDKNHTPRGLQAAMLAKVGWQDIALRVCTSSDERRSGCCAWRALQRERAKPEASHATR